MKRFITFICLSMLLYACKSNVKINETNYKYADLLFRYIKEYQLNKINEKDYYFLLFRTKSICNACYTISLDSSFQIALSKSKEKNIYILFDEEQEYIRKMASKKKCEIFLLDETTDLNQYGLTNTYPLLFHIESNRLIDFDKIIR